MYYILPFFIVIKNEKKVCRRLLSTAGVVARFRPAVPPTSFATRTTLNLPIYRCYNRQPRWGLNTILPSTPCCARGYHWGCPSGTTHNTPIQYFLLRTTLARRATPIIAPGMTGGRTYTQDTPPKGVAQMPLATRDNINYAPTYAPPR